MAPQQIANRPAADQTTLILANVSDLSPGSSTRSSSSPHRTDQSHLRRGRLFASTRGAYTNSDPRYVPKFTRDGAPGRPAADSYTGYSAERSAARRR